MVTEAVARRQGFWKPAKVYPEVAGKVRYSYKELRRILGESAFSLWVWMQINRKQDGSVTWWNKRLLAAAGKAKLLGADRREGLEERFLTISQIRRAVVRLRKTGLFQDGRGLTKKVLGSYSSGSITVPSEVELKLRNLPLKGGPRHGKKVVRGTLTKLRPEYKIPKETRVQRKRFKAPVQTTDPNIKALIEPHQSAHSKTKRRIKDSSLKKEKKAAAADSVGFSSKNQNPRAPAPPQHECSEAPLRAPSGETFADIFKRPAGRPRLPPRDITALVNIRTTKGEKVIPPFPSADLIGRAKAPAPPALNPALDDNDKIRTMVSAYRAAMERFFKISYMAYSRGIHRDNPLRKKLLEAAEQLLEHGVEPIGWVAFSIEQFREMSGKNRPPPLGWVWSGVRIAKQAGWFAKYRVAGGRLYMTDKHRLLFRRYHAMAEQIWALGDRPTDRGLRDVVERFFPGGWEPHYQEAKDSVQETQAALLSLLDRGAWIW